MKIKELKEEHPAIYDRWWDEITNYGNRVTEADDDCNIEYILHFITYSGDRFWREIISGDYDVFYKRYPEHSKQPVNVEEKDWSKSPYELLKKCEMDYPHGTDALFGRCKRPGKVSWPLKFVECQGVSDNDRNMVFTFEYGFAEIVSQPKGIRLEDNTTPQERLEIESQMSSLFNSTEPKAGDMVEVRNSSKWSESLWGYLGVKTSLGKFVCQDENGDVDSFNDIRLPRKSEVESKAEEFMDKIKTSPTNGIVSYANELFKQAIKWGQQNPNSK